MEKLSKDDIARIINSPALSKEDVVEIIKKELEIDIDPNLSKEEMIEEVHSYYITSLIHVEEKKKVARLVGDDGRKVRKTKDGGPSRKQFIIELIAEGKYTKEGLLEILADKFGYTIKGKSPKVRLSRVIRELRRSNKLDESAADGILKLK